MTGTVEATPRLTVSVPPGALREALGALPDGVELLEWDLDGPAPRDHIDLVVRPNVRGLEPLEWLSTVSARLVQSPAIGFDGVAGVLPPGHVLANAAGVHEDSTAEQALALVLAAQRDVPYYVHTAVEGRWATRTSPGVLGRTVLLLGVGVSAGRSRPGCGRSVRRSCASAEPHGTGCTGPTSCRCSCPEPTSWS